MILLPVSEAVWRLLTEQLDVLAGVRSVTLYYRSVKDKLAAEVMTLDVNGLIARVEVHYRDGNGQATDGIGER